MLPPLLKLLERVAPGIKIAVKPIEVDRLERQMERGEVDLALMPQGNAPAALNTEVLLHESFVCVVCRNHPEIQQQIDLNRYCELEHILVAPRENDFSGVVDRVLSLHDRNRNVSISLPNFLLVPEIIENSRRIATIPSRLARRYRSRWQILEPPLEIPGFTIALVWHPKTHQDSAQIWFREMMGDIVSQL